MHSFFCVQWFVAEMIVFFILEKCWPSHLNFLLRNCCGPCKRLLVLFHLTIFQLSRGCQFYWWRKLEYTEKITDLYHILLYRVHIAWAGFKLTLVVIGTECIGSCKSNYCTITATTAPSILVYITKYMYSISIVK